MTSTAESARIYTIDALLSEGFSRAQIFRYRKTGVLPPAEGRGRHAYYTDQHLKIVRAIKRAKDERVRLEDIAERYGREFRGQM